MIVSAIIVAAGKGSRMNSNINKQYLSLANKPVLAHAIEAFELSCLITEIVVVIHQQDQKIFENTVLKPYNFSKISAVVYGGADRQASVYNGLLKVSPKADIISIHDGARPLVTREIISDSISVAAQKGAACVGVPVKDTIKKVNSDNFVVETKDRSFLWAIQTPQVFKRDIIIKAHEEAIFEGFRGTDDSVLVEKLGLSVPMVMGSYTNIKITTGEDLVIADALIKNR